MSIDLRALLTAMSEGEGIPSTQALLALSDLSREQMRTFREVWPHLPDDQRSLIAQLLVELAEASFEVHFGAIFRACLEDLDARVRSFAIQGLWEDQDEGLVGPFLRILRADPAVEVRAAAAQSLGRFVLLGELEEMDSRMVQRVIDALLAVIHAPDESVEVRRRAVESVAFCPEAEVQAVVEAAYYDDDEGMRLSAVCGMGRSLDRRWEPILWEELRSPTPAMRYEAVIACGEIGSRRAVPAIIHMIHDPDPVVREAALASLGRIGGEAARSALMAAYDEMDTDLREVIEEALSELEFASDDLDFLLYDLAPEARAAEADEEWIMMDDLDADLEASDADAWEDEWSTGLDEDDSPDSVEAF